MPKIHPIAAIEYNFNEIKDLSSLIAPPYDVLDECSKQALLDRNPNNIVKVDLPHLPPKTVGPDETYLQSAEVFKQWIDSGVLRKRTTPAIYVYQQTYTVSGTEYKRRGLIANVQLQDFGPGENGNGGIFPHEQTFSAPKEDRLKLMKATQAQLSPIFGLFADQAGNVQPLLDKVADAGNPTFTATTTNDGVFHEVWVIEKGSDISKFQDALGPCDTFIADGHHRYGTALNYREDMGPFAEGHTGNQCLFVLVALSDPGCIVLPTHRVLGGMKDYSFEKFAAASAGKLVIKPFDGTMEELEAALPDAGPHAMGLYDPKAGLHIATTVDTDPLKESHGNMSDAWRQLDVAVLQHLIVEGICEPTFCDGSKATWKFPHDLKETKTITDSESYDLGVIMQATPIESIGDVCSSGELMPQKSTFFYPKLATGLAINPVG
ncbi:MAG TPA: hypothetical protein DCM28_08570 [Phycisphaerales bacterium]|nr:hypothetical protein [Phycisphaerales bacterium]HCD34960.1 hypothetical protein [Phycisphaerales bacterium]